MTMNTLPESQLDARPPEGRTKGRRFSQVGLRTALLITACIASWIMVPSNLREARLLESRLELMRPLAGVLSITDPSRIAVLKVAADSWHDEENWQVYIPDDSCKLYLTTRNIPADMRAAIDREGVQSIALSPGKHLVGLSVAEEDEGWVIKALVDGQALLEIHELYRWREKSGPRQVAGANAKQFNFPVGRPAYLFRQRFSLGSASRNGPNSTRDTNEPSKGLALWIDRETPFSAED